MTCGRKEQNKKPSLSYVNPPPPHPSPIFLRRNLIEKFSHYLLPHPFQLSEFSHFHFNFSVFIVLNHCITNDPQLEYRFNFYAGVENYTFVLACISEKYFNDFKEKRFRWNTGEFPNRFISPDRLWASITGETKQNVNGRSLLEISEISEYRENMTFNRLH